MNIDACAQEAFEEERVEDEWVCWKCRGGVALKRCRIESIPRMLLLQLKRFLPTIQGYQKNHNPVILGDTIHLGHQKYHIIGRVNHSGESMDSGHYTADLKLGGMWIHCNDQSCFNRAPVECSAEVYLVVAERMDDEE